MIEDLKGVTSVVITSKNHYELFCDLYLAYKNTEYLGEPKPTLTFTHYKVKITVKSF